MMIRGDNWQKSKNIERKKICDYIEICALIMINPSLNEYNETAHYTTLCMLGAQTYDVSVPRTCITLRPNPIPGARVCVWFFFLRVPVTRFRSIYSLILYTLTDFFYSTIYILLSIYKSFLVTVASDRLIYGTALTSWNYWVDGDQNKSNQYPPIKKWNLHCVRVQYIIT
jgi:hypothetical protein